MDEVRYFRDLGPSEQKIYHGQLRAEVGRLRSLKLLVPQTFLLNRNIFVIVVGSVLLLFAGFLGGLAVKTWWPFLILVFAFFVIEMAAFGVRRLVIDMRVGKLEELRWSLERDERPEGTR